MLAKQLFLDFCRFSETFDLTDDPFLVDILSHILGER